MVGSPQISCVACRHMTNKLTKNFPLLRIQNGENKWGDGFSDQYVYKKMYILQPNPSIFIKDLPMDLTREVEGPMQKPKKGKCTCPRKSTFMCNKIAAVHEKAHFWLFLVEISLHFGKALK